MLFNSKKTKFGDIEIGEGAPTFIICEAGVTNYGDLTLAKKQIDAAVEAGADAIKFQVWRTEDMISKKAAKALEKELGYDWFERMKYKEFTSEELKEIKRYCGERGITFFATPHDEWSLNFLINELGVPFIKIGSGESSNYDFLAKVAQTNKPIFISFGMQTDEEIVRAIKTLQESGAGEIIVFHCVSIYPTPPQMVDLRKIKHLQELLKIPIGISDHSAGWHIPLAAVAMGVSVIEKHLTFDKDDPRSLDNPGALLPEEFKYLVGQIRDIETAKIPPLAGLLKVTTPIVITVPGSISLAAIMLCKAQSLAFCSNCCFSSSNGWILAVSISLI